MFWSDGWTKIYIFLLVSETANKTRIYDLMKFLYSNLLKNLLRMQSNITNKCHIPIIK